MTDRSVLQESRQNYLTEQVVMPGGCRLTAKITPGKRSSAGVGAGVGLEQMLAIDLGIALRGREAGMAQQLLDGAEIGAGAQQMRGEGMPERMRRRRIGQAESDAGACDPELDDARRKLASA